jgi:hypothetical protein
MTDWEAVFTQLAELRREVGRAQGLLDAANAKLDAIRRELRAAQWWILILAGVLAVDFVATAVALRIVVR